MNGIVYQSYLVLKGLVPCPSDPFPSIVCLYIAGHHHRRTEVPNANKGLGMMLGLRSPGTTLPCTYIKIYSFIKSTCILPTATVELSVNNVDLICQHLFSRNIGY